MLKKDKVQVALLQETHLTDLKHLKLKLKPQWKKR